MAFSFGDIAKLMNFGAAVGAAVADVEDFNERLDEADAGDEVTLDIPDDHEPRYPFRLKGGHKARVSKITFRKS